MTWSKQPCLRWNDIGLRRWLQVWSHWIQQRIWTKHNPVASASTSDTLYRWDLKARNGTCTIHNHRSSKNVLKPQASSEFLKKKKKRVLCATEMNHGQLLKHHGEDIQDEKSAYWWTEYTATGRQSPWHCKVLCRDHHHNTRHGQFKHCLYDL